MKIKEILNRNRRDFTAIYQCEHCGFEEESGGYDDSYFHQEIIPKMKCDKCGKIAPKDSLRLAPRYADHVAV